MLGSESPTSRPRHIAHSVQSFFSALSVRSCRDDELGHLPMEFEKRKRRGQVPSLILLFPFIRRQQTLVGPLFIDTLSEVIALLGGLYLELKHLQ